MGFWYMVKKLKNTKGTGTDEKYTCEQIIYTKTGPNTFSKIADVHL